MLSTFMKITRVNSGAPDIRFFPVLHSTSSLVCKRRRSVPRQVPSQFTKWRYLPMELCDVMVRIKYGNPWFTQRGESVSGARSGWASLYIRREVLLRMFEKVSRSLSTIQIFFFVHKHIGECGSLCRIVTYSSEPNTKVYSIRLHLFKHFFFLRVVQGYRLN